MRVRGSLLPVALLGLLLGSLPVEAAGAARTRGGGSSGASRSSPSAQTQGRTASRPGSGSPTRRAEGKATWRHGFGHRHLFDGWWGGHLGWDLGWWGPYGSLYWGWGPYAYGYGAYGYGAYGPGGPGWGPDVEVVGEAWVETDVRPKRATVLLDGEDVGTAKDWNGVWDRLPVEPGGHVLEFVLDGHQTLQVHLDARPGRIYHVDRELRRGEGLDPRSTREPPRRRARPRASEDDRSDWDRDDDGPSSVRARGTVRWTIEPADAAVYLDGRFLGRAGDLRRMQGTRSLPSGEHELEVVRPGFRSERRRVVVEPDELSEVRIELEAEDEAEGRED